MSGNPLRNSVPMVATLAAWGFCLMWAFSIGYFSRYSPVFMFFERESYDKMRMHDFERRMGSVNPQMSEILRSHLRFNDASEIPGSRLHAHLPYYAIVAVFVSACLYLLHHISSFSIVQHRRCFAFMSMNRSYPYLDHGMRTPRSNHNSLTSSKASCHWPRRCAFLKNFIHPLRQ
jgi:hypothetical protein